MATEADLRTSLSQWKYRLSILEDDLESASIAGYWDDVHDIEDELDRAEARVAKLNRMLTNREFDDADTK